MSRGQGGTTAAAWGIGTEVKRGFTAYDMFAILERLVSVDSDGVAGPASSTDGNIPTFDGVGGHIIKDSGVGITEVVLNSDFDANTILAADIDNTPAALTVTEQTVVGRITGGTIAALSITEIKTMLGLDETWSIDIPARDWDVMTPQGMGGDGADPLKERLDNGFERYFMLFGYEAAQYACTAIVLPENYVSGSLTATLRWETESDTIGTCIMKIYGDLLDDGDPSAVALTSSIATITDTSNGAAKINISPVTAMSPAGTGKYLIMRITRDYGTDTIEDDIKMLGITIAGTKVVTS
jgi:hypothetical protein